MPTTAVLPLHGPLTLEQAIRAVAKAFEAASLNYGHGTDNALDEASWLLMHVLGLPVDQPPNYAQSIAESQRAQGNELIERRIRERVPVAYLTGRAWFAGHEFYCDERALVPRSPLAEFINNDFFGLFQNEHSVLSNPPARILDLCTGGGCIGISCALATSGCEVVCSDISKEALELAATNVEKHHLQDRVSLVESDLFTDIDGRYDLIVTNPPYVDANDIAAMPEEFHAEPMLGLAAGRDGLDLVRTMIEQAPEHLTEHGWLVVEVGNSQRAMEKAYEHLPLSWLEFSYGGHGVFAINAKKL